ncbi:MAG: RluA family pseudouridine synthase [Chitinispirillaceae bacterium]|nr:RluA family pseudouridine synthase [Chitinispirillaceae bacterium]
MQQITIGPEDAGCRVDRLLRKRLALLPLAGIYTLIRKGGVRIGSRKTRQDYRLQEGEVLQIDVDQAEIRAPAAPDNALRSLTCTSFFKKNFSIIYEDDHLLACNKPSGLVVHPGSGHTRRDSLIELATAYLLDTNGIAPGDEVALVHRLDRDTSGVILVAKNKRTLRSLHEAFLQHAVEKEYRAVCHHRPPEYEGEISVNLSRTHERNRGMKMRVDREGDAARSRYQITEYRNDLSRVTVFLETGKTHQIRVQMAHVGSPIVGDVRYGDGALDAKLPSGPPSRLFLHAHRLSLKHPQTQKPLTIKATVPKEFAGIMGGEGV